MNQKPEKMNESILGGLLIGYLSAEFIWRTIKFIYKRLANKSDRTLVSELMKVTAFFILNKKDIGISELDDRYYISLPNDISSLQDFRILKNERILQLPHTKIQLTDEEYNNFLNVLKYAK